MKKKALDRLSWVVYLVSSVFFQDYLLDYQGHPTVTQGGWWLTLLWAVLTGYGVVYLLRLMLSDSDEEIRW